jgi:urease accessory protein
MRGDKPFVFTNCKTGEGISELVDLIRKDLLFDMPSRLVFPSLVADQPAP